MSDDPRRAYFDAARAADADGVLVLDDIAKIHAVLDLAGVARLPATKVIVAPAGSATRNLGSRGLDLIRNFEGCARLRADGLVEAYPDPGTGGAPWTIGWGHTGSDVGPGTVWTREKCDSQLVLDLAKYASDVARAIGDAPTTQAQFDAMVSFHYNTGAIARATLTKLHREGKFAAAAREFARWNRAGGRVLAGLTRRRASEAKLYAGG